MRSADDDLLNCLRRHSTVSSGVDARLLLSNIKRFELQAILASELKKLDRNEYSAAMNMIAWQRSRNQVLENELQLLSVASRRAGIKLVPFKGLCLAWDLYMPPETRLFGDTDVLIREEDLGLCMDTLRELGYQGTQRVCRWFGRVDALASFEGNHFGVEKILQAQFTSVNASTPPSFLQTISRVVEVSLTGLKDTWRFQWRQVLEVHVKLFASLWDCNINVADIVSRSVNRSARLGEFWLLELHDRLLYLVVHFAKHYLERWQRSDKLVFPRIRHLHDIALLLDKYSKLVDWNIVIKRVDEWQVHPAAAFVFQLVDHVYPDRIPPRCMEELMQHATHYYGSTFPNEALLMLIDEGPERILKGISPELINSVIPFPRVGGPEIRCTFKNNGSEYLENFTIYSQVETASTECLATGCTSWDESSLYIHITIYSDEIAVGVREPYVIALAFYDGESRPCVRKLSTNPRIKQGPIALGLPTGIVPSHRIDDDSGHYEVKLHNDGYEVTLVIPWSTIRIEPQIGKQIGFDIAIKDHATGPILGTWSGSSQRLWEDPTSYGRLVLVRCAKQQQGS